MKLTLEISMENAAFDDSPLAEAARILREAAGMLDTGADNGKLRDVNGNTVGFFEVDRSE